MRYRSALVAMALLMGGAQGQTAPDPALVQHSRDIVAGTKDADGVFQVQDDGTIRHLQSGMVCRATWPNVSLVRTTIFPAPGKGEDVGCDYLRPDGKGGGAAKLTVFATRKPGVTLDQAFAAYRAELMQMGPDARSLGIALKSSPGGKDNLPNIRSEEFARTLNNRLYTDQLFVAVVKDWVIEVRNTFEGAPNEVRMETSDIQKAVQQVDDRRSGFLALFEALGAVGK